MSTDNPVRERDIALLRAVYRPPHYWALTNMDGVNEPQLISRASIVITDDARACEAHVILGTRTPEEIADVLDDLAEQGLSRTSAVWPIPAEPPEPPPDLYGLIS